ncbi:hypothetical protein QAD02_009658 [Eretmocerus hayati]|uniref:Uncharacterized protein n=1 Tax=Eretmocerus hayati TaxID=131215 RepID=A0ACC2NEH0_9HYME|nr:hypothetical protein QAD02_009658 [Eretmocerus hayati]
MNDMSVSIQNISRATNCSGPPRDVATGADEEPMSGPERVGSSSYTSGGVARSEKHSSCCTDYGSSEEEDVRELRNWMVTEKISLKSGDGLLQILRKKRMPNLPACTKTFLKKESKFRAEPMDASDGSTGEFVYIGIEKKNFKRR